jgi:hypothetical protein
VDHPREERPIQVTLRNGSAGFLLVHFLLWWAEVIEPLAGKVVDDWGWAIRAIRGQTTGYSNHASGTAADANATRHPLGTHTLTVIEKAKIWIRLKIYAGVLRCGAFYSGRVDEMHTELNVGPDQLALVEKVARRLMLSPRGRRVLEANPGQRAVILS